MSETLTKMTLTLRNKESEVIEEFVYDMLMQVYTARSEGIKEQTVGCHSLLYELLLLNPKFCIQPPFIWIRVLNKRVVRNSPFCERHHNDLYGNAFQRLIIS